MEGRDTNCVVKDCNGSVLQAVHKSIPRGARKAYRPCWNGELEKLHGELSEARQEAETNPTQEINNKLQHAKVKFRHLTLSELQAALRQLNNKKSPGPDGVTNEMLTHLSNTAMYKIYNHSWSSCTMPQI